MPKFFSEGIQFSCTTCGNCCRTPGGKVSVNNAEIADLADHLRIDPKTLVAQMCTVNGKKINLNEQSDGACIFLRDDRCLVYKSRPVQCRTFPFWPENLKSPYRWKQLKADCPGIETGDWFSGNKIQELLKLQKQRDKEG